MAEKGYNKRVKTAAANSQEGVGCQQLMVGGQSCFFTFGQTHQRAGCVFTVHFCTVSRIISEF